MTIATKRVARLALAATLAAWTVQAASAQEEKEKKLGWADSAELAFVTTAGNSQATTFGFRNTLSHIWQDAQLVIEANGLRSETSTTSHVAVGTSPSDFQVTESSTSDLTAENYFFRGKYDRNLSEKLFWYAGAGWDRNPFAGIRNRYQTAGGIGNLWFDRETTRFRTDYGLSYTRQEGTASSLPDESFIGLRLSSDYWRQVTSSTKYATVAILDENLEETDDLRFDWTHSVAVSMTQTLALKISLQLLFDNLPSFIDVPLVLPTGDPAGTNVLISAEKWDTFFNIALVVNF